MGSKGAFQAFFMLVRQQEDGTDSFGCPVEQLLPRNGTAFSWRCVFCDFLVGSSPGLFADLLPFFFLLHSHAHVCRLFLGTRSNLNPFFPLFSLLFLQSSQYRFPPPPRLAPTPLSSLLTQRPRSGLRHGQEARLRRDPFPFVFRPFLRRTRRCRILLGCADYAGCGAG